MLARCSSYLAVAVALNACAPRTPATTTPVLALEPTQSTPDRPELPAAAASFAELVHVAATREGEPGTSCVFEEGPAGLRMLGMSSAALRPLPPPEPKLDLALAKSVSVNVLTPFGRYGNASGALTLASFTYAPPTREALALVVTDVGIALRGTSASVPMRDRLTLADAVQAASTLMPATVFVSAEAPVAAHTLAALLRALTAQHVPVALAVALASSTRLPEPPNRPSADTCPDGLPDTTEPEGALDVGAVTSALSTLRTQAVDCLSSADPRGAAGGHVSLLLRVSRTGVLENACIDKDEIGDARLRACILEQARKLHFPQPSPPGSVDFALPLALVSSQPPPPPLLCAEAAP